MQNKRFPLSRRLIVSGAILVVVLLIAGNFQSIVDAMRLYNYQPTQQIIQLADQTTMTPKARRLFYINHPEIEGRNNFNDDCNNRGEQTIVLGCYHAVDRGIYLFDVTEPRLNGVEQVTAAHEMLHAAYDRLSSSERKKINNELQQFYDTKVQDARIRSTMAAYQKSEPNDVQNEMHSIFATEIGSLTPELETYYQQYFSNRSAVVTLAGSYQQEFTSRQDQVAAYDKQLIALKSAIDTNTATLKKREAEIGSLQREMERQRASDDVEAYNANVPIYNAKVDQYNSLIHKTQSDIAEYNRIVSVRNSIAVEVRELTQSIDSKLSPISQ